MNRWYVVVALGGVLAGCPNPDPTTCQTDSQCASGKACCNQVCKAVLSDVENCGACGAVCPGGNAVPSCVGGSCQLACVTDYGNCNNSIFDGCETHLTVTEAHCGGCGNVCT